MKKGNCEMCLIPLAKDKNAESDKYCSYCYKDDELLYKGGDLAEFKSQSYQGMLDSGMNKWQARFFTWMIGFAPYWKDKK